MPNLKFRKVTALPAAASTNTGTIYFNKTDGTISVCTGSGYDRFNQRLVDASGNALNVGGLNQPVFFSNGVPVAMNSGIGSETQPVFVSPSGNIYPCNNVHVKDTNVEWGGPNLVGSIGPLAASLSSEHSANRLAFINGDALTFEYSTDAGSTWTDYGWWAASKTAVFTKDIVSIPVGRASSETEYQINNKSRVTITAQNGTTGYVYTQPRKIIINVATSATLYVQIEVRTGANYISGGSWANVGTYQLTGWSGWNDIPLNLGTLGGGSTQTSNYWQLRFTFYPTTKSTDYPRTCEIRGIRLFGDTCWTRTSNMGDTNHLYDFDMSQNAIFPANVTASSIIKSGGTASQVLLADGNIMTFGDAHQKDGSGNLEDCWVEF